MATVVIKVQAFCSNCIWYVPSKNECYNFSLVNTLYKNNQQNYALKICTDLHVSKCKLLGTKEASDWTGFFRGLR